MIPAKYQAQRIVRSYPGQGTAETVYVTEDGTHWVEDSSDHSNETMPPRLGRIVNGVVVPR